MGEDLAMNLIEQLSSQSGDRTQQANLQVARQCLDDPSLLAVIAAAGDPDRLWPVTAPE
jgi:hypothetical protein